MYLDGFLCLTWGGYQRPIAWAAVQSRWALPKCLQAAVVGAWVGNRVWQDGFGNWKRGRLRHTTCGVERRGGHTSNSVISGVSGVKGFRLQRLGTSVGFPGAGMRMGPGKTMQPPETGVRWSCFSHHRGHNCYATKDTRL